MYKIILMIMCMVNLINAMDFEAQSTKSNSPDSHIQQNSKPRAFLKNEKIQLELQNVPNQLNTNFWIQNSEEISSGKYTAFCLENCQVNNENFLEGAEFGCSTIEIINCNFNLEGLEDLLGRVRWETLQKITLKNTEIKNDQTFQKLAKEVWEEGGPKIIIEE